MGQKCCTDHFTVVALLLMQGVPRCPQCQGSKLCPRAALHKPEGTQPLSAVCHSSAVPAGCLLPARGSEAKGATLGIFCCLCLACCRCWGCCSSSPMAGWHRSALPCPAPAAAGSPRVNLCGQISRGVPCVTSRSCLGGQDAAAPWAAIPWQGEQALPEPLCSLLGPAPVLPALISAWTPFCLSLLRQQCLHFPAFALGAHPLPAASIFCFQACGRVLFASSIPSGMDPSVPAVRSASGR